MHKSSQLAKSERTFVSIYVDPEMKTQLEDLAAENERSLSAQVRLMLSKSLKARSRRAS